MDGTSTVTSSDRRDFFRVQARIPFRVRSVDAVEATGLAFEIASPRTELEAISDPGVAIALARIETKVDRILAALDRSVPKPLWDGDSREVSISAAGIGLQMQDGPVEDPVLVEFLLPESPSRHVRALARPIACDPARDDRAFSFEVISEADREAIVRFSREVQRSMLRMRATAS